MLDIEEHYDAPFGAALLGMWTARGDDDGVWMKRPTDTEVVTGTGFFDTPIKRTDSQRITRPVDVVIGVENTRATSLSWPDDIRRGFNEELNHHLRSQTEVHLTQRTSLTMARRTAAVL